MVLRKLAFSAAFAIALGGAAHASEIATPDQIASETVTDYIKKGGKHGWKHRGRGHHYGWYKHRRHYGLRRGHHRGWRHGFYPYPRRIYSYGGPSYSYRVPSYSYRAYGYRSQPYSYSYRQTAPSYRQSAPFAYQGRPIMEPRVTGSTRSVGSPGHPGKHKGWDKH
jgi:hypothetical protein